MLLPISCSFSHTYPLSSTCYSLCLLQSKKPFHCVQCGFCRVGGADSFRHCDECCMCISRSVYNTHQCFKDKYKNNCPVCREDMFSSRQSPQDLPCGHAIHAHCFRKLAGFDYRCPICKKTVVSQQSMAAAWEARARDIAEHPMPAELQRVVDIMCNDCENKSHRRQWHFLGIQCPRCNSFNTVVEQVLSFGDGTTMPSNNANSA
jgi:RING finger and CHY zinc finger domain-containing protein 1